jgi:hypothetical protein
MIRDKKRNKDNSKINNSDDSEVETKTSNTNNNSALVSPAPCSFWQPPKRQRQKRSGNDNILVDSVIKLISHLTKGQSLQIQPKDDKYIYLKGWQSLRVVLTRYMTRWFKRGSRREVNYKLVVRWQILSQITIYIWWHNYKTTLRLRIQI